MNLEKIKEIVLEILNREGIELVSLKPKKEHGLSILKITVDKENLNAQHLGEINQQINDAIDPYLPEHYYLEVSTAGAIRPINSLDEAKRYIGKYVYIETQKENFKGVLLEVSDLEVTIQINLKGRLKKITLDYTSFKTFELTVKF